MDLLNEFGKRVSSMARSVSEKSKEGAEVTRLNAELKAAEAALEQLYARYGRECFAMQAGGGDAKAADDLAVRIRAARLQLAELTERRDAAREVRRCLSCGAVHPKEAKFCSACGKRLPDDTPKPKPVEPGEYCPNCGAVREGAEPRCPVCGRFFDVEDAGDAANAAPLPPVEAGPDVEEPDAAEE